MGLLGSLHSLSICFDLGELYKNNKAHSLQQILN